MEEWLGEPLHEWKVVSSRPAKATFENAYHKR
jgi:hypothetical protein